MNDPVSTYHARIEVTRYGSRNWAVWFEGQLLAVTLYKKGARAVAHTLTRLTTHPEPSANIDTHAR